jgi:methylated-DNA-[protein]-cysteine S-methyltransferase
MPSAVNDCYFTAFATRLGWMALVANGNHLKQLVFGYPSKKAALAALRNELITTAKPQDAESALVKRLRAYAEGNPDDFRDIVVETGKLTAFQQKVQKLCRQIPFGKTMTYGELAAKAGAPGAARAVGSCMARNCFPLVVPCHRVVPAGGRLGNYSAPGGTETKQRLLDMERAAK